MQWLFPALVVFFVVTSTYARRHRYLKCAEQTHLNPGVCDCTKSFFTRCFIKLTLTKVRYDNSSKIDESQVFSVNGGRIGPTIIVRYNQLVVADVYNGIHDPEVPEDANTSIHWHGMHQWDTAYMDGVAMVTQWPTKPKEAFRYVFKAKPPGTHWYHSHVLSQRDQGIVGALIVKDTPESEHTNDFLQDVVDEPAEQMLAIRDHEVESSTPPTVCEPDMSKNPLDPKFVGFKSQLGAFRINGVRLVDSPIKPDRNLTFYVSAGRKYRFRIVGIMSTYVIRFSIFKHKLHVISTDGFLTKPYTVDVIDIHMGERYDFIIETNEELELDLEGGNVFPIRIETVAIDCGDHTKPSKVSYAFLEYFLGKKTVPKLVSSHEMRPVGNIKRDILNCPFERYAIGSDYVCHSVEKLQLLNPTPEERIPTGEPDEEYFFNFGFRSRGFAAINSVSNELPSNIPFIHPPDSESVENKCEYGTAPCEGKCAHVVTIRKEQNPDGRFKVKKVRFVFSSISNGGSGNDHTPNVITHPIHLHGHSFFVAKIGYPKYNESGHIVKQNEEIAIPECGPGHWADGAPEDISVNATTVRKDVIIVPAGGYVVIEFLADNPGVWFMHCHIDRHLELGMAIAVDELPDCQTAPQNDKFKVKDSYLKTRFNFWWYTFIFGDKCKIRQSERIQNSAILHDETEPDEQIPDFIQRERNKEYM